MFSLRVNVFLKNLQKEKCCFQKLRSFFFCFVFNYQCYQSRINVILSTQFLLLIKTSWLPDIKAWILSWRQRKLPVLSKIKAATARQNNGLITEEEKEGSLFSHRPDLVFWRVTLWLYRTRLLCIQKVRKINQNPRIWLARFITAKRVKVLAVIRFSSQI